MANIVKSKEEESGMEIFGGVDRTKDGRIASEYPSYQNDPHLEELCESISSRERALENGQIAQERIQKFRFELKRDKERYEAIMASRPKMNGFMKDKVVKAHAALGDKISAAMYTRKEEENRLTDAHEELRRMTEPCVEVPNEAAWIVQKVGITIEKGKITRNQATRVWRILAGMLEGESRNPETLRRAG